MAVTIEEIAKRAGVSPGTVSRVLNGLNKENRPAIARRSAKIRQIARELNYRPNHAARQMLRGRFDLIGFLNCGEPGFDWFPHQLLHGIHDTLYARNTRLVVTEIEGKKFNDPTYVPTFLRQATVDGLIVHPGTAETSPVTAFFDGDPLPAVYVNSKFPYQAVHPDDHAMAYDSTVRLIEAGHRNIGFYRPVFPDQPTHYSIQDRVAGFEQAMVKHGLSPHRSTYPQAVYDYFDAMPSALGFLDSHPDLTAALCYDLPQAVALHHAAHLRGYRPPHDFCIVVFYANAFHCNTGIGMATAIIPFYDVGKTTVDMIYQIMEGASGSVPSVKVPSKELIDEDLILPPAKKD